MGYFFGQPLKLSPLSKNTDIYLGKHLNHILSFQIIPIKNRIKIKQEQEPSEFVKCMK